MKRFIYGFFAIMFAISMAAFTTPKTAASLDDAYFEFDYQYDPTIENVEDESKWKPALDMNGCSTADDRACKIRVGSGYYSGSTLSTIVNIVAEESDDDVAFVLDAEAILVVNNSNP
jgi:FAD/FMN-containing dehydrogenase